VKIAVLLIADAATLYMAEVNWFLQVVHHPLYDRIGRETFAEYESANTVSAHVHLCPRLACRRRKSGYRDHHG
jgi:hypothetical protein